MIGEFLVDHPSVEPICIGLVVFIFVVWLIVRRSKLDGVYGTQFPQPSFNVDGQRITLDANVNLRLGRTAKDIFRNFDFNDFNSRFHSD